MRRFKGRITVISSLLIPIHLVLTLHPGKVEIAANVHPRALSATMLVRRFSNYISIDSSFLIL